jgi:PHS family inorganic phosphate transporter-like MFS transporter
MIVSAVFQSMSFGSGPDAVVGTLCFWRFVLGFGVGGDYPLSATIMSEYSSAMSRGAYIGSVFAMQVCTSILAPNPSMCSFRVSFYASEFLKLAYF